MRGKKPSAAADGGSGDRSLHARASSGLIILCDDHITGCVAPPPGALPRKRPGQRTVISDVSPETPDQHHLAASLLSGHGPGQPGPGGPAQTRRSFADLRLDQVIAKVAGGPGRARPDHRPALPAGPRHRHPAATGTRCSGTWRIPACSGGRPVRRADCGRCALIWRQLRAGCSSGHQREGWFLDAAAIYCDAVRALAADLACGAARLARPAGLPRLPCRLCRLARVRRPGRRHERPARPSSARITYQVRVQGLRVEVSRYDGEPDYSAEIEKTFKRFQQGAVKDYRVKYRPRPGMNHVGAADPRPGRAPVHRRVLARWPATAAEHAAVHRPGRRAVRPRAAVLPGLPRLHRAAALGRAQLLLPGARSGLEGDLRPRHLRPGARGEAHRRTASRLSPMSSASPAPSASSSCPGRTRAARPRSPGPSVSCITWPASAARSPAARPACSCPTRSSPTSSGKKTSLTWPASSKMTSAGSSEVLLAATPSSSSS